MHRRRVGLAERIVIAVEQPCAEILAFADDGRVGHAVENIAHLLCDRVQSAANDLKGNGIDRSVGHEFPFQAERRATRMSPCDSTDAT